MSGLSELPRLDGKRLPDALPPLHPLLQRARAAAKLLRNAEDAAAEALDVVSLSVSRCLVLEALAYRAGPVSISEISRTLGVHRTSVASIVDALEGAGLVMKTIDPRDRRCAAVCLTVEGQRRLEAARSALARLSHSKRPANGHVADAEGAGRPGHERAARRMIGGAERGATGRDVKIDDPATLTWNAMSVKASEVESIEVVSGLGEGLTLLVTQADGALLAAPYVKISSNTLGAFVVQVEQNGRSVWIPRFLRPG